MNRIRVAKSILLVVGLLCCGGLGYMFATDPLVMLAICGGWFGMMTLAWALCVVAEES